MNQILGYTIFRRENSLQLFANGFYITREKAFSMMIYQVEEYCEKKVGEDNFIIGQIEKPELKSSIRDGLVLIQEPEYEIKVIKRTPSYIPFRNYDETEICRFGILPITQQQIVIRNSSGKKEIIEPRIDLIPLSYQVQREKECKIKDNIVKNEEITKKIISSVKTNNSEMDLTIFEAMRKELTEAIQKRRIKNESKQEGKENEDEEIDAYIISDKKDDIEINQEKIENVENK